MFIPFIQNALEAYRISQKLKYKNKSFIQKKKWKRRLNLTSDR